MSSWCMESTFGWMAGTDGRIYVCLWSECSYALNLLAVLGFVFTFRRRTCHSACQGLIFWRNKIEWIENSRYSPNFKATIFILDIPFATKHPLKSDGPIDGVLQENPLRQLAAVLRPQWLPHRSSKCHISGPFAAMCAYVLIRMPERKILLPQAKRQNINVFSAYWSIIYCSMDFTSGICHCRCIQCGEQLFAVFGQSRPFAYCPVPSTVWEVWTKKSNNISTNLWSFSSLCSHNGSSLLATTAAVKHQICSAFWISVSTENQFTNSGLREKINWTIVFFFFKNALSK